MVVILPESRFADWLIAPAGDTTDYPKQFPADELTAEGTDLALLKKASSKIGDNANVSPHNQPSKGHAKNIATGVAENWFRCFGEMPKADLNDASKTTFTKFLRALATELSNGANDHARLSLYSEGFSIGPAVAHQAVVN